MVITKEQGFEDHLRTLQHNNTNWHIKDIKSTTDRKCKRLEETIETLQARLEVARDELSYYTEFSEYLAKKGDLSH